MNQAIRTAAPPVATTPTPTPLPSGAKDRPPAPVRRVRSLDGLRGLAAVIVVIHHSVLALPAADQALAGSAGVGSASWWFTYSPLHLLWAGEEAVLVFFVLSGFVLALPATIKAIRWRVYYVKRLLRIYLPVWASLLVAMVIAVLTRSETSPQRSDYVNARSDVPLTEAPMDAVLVAGAGLLNGPLWSLQWEIIFSLLLPAYLLLAYPSLTRRHRLMLPVVVVGLFGLIALGTLVDSGALRFLPMFAIGVLMAFNQDALQAAADRLARSARPRLAWGALAALTVILLTGRWTAAGLPVDSRLIDAAASGGSFVAACLAVFIALHWPVARALLERRSWQWLGTVSFSLYVIHEPIVVATALLLPAGAGQWATPLIAIPIAILAASAFFRLVEGPSLSLAKLAGRAMDRPRPARRFTPAARR